jgi:DNA-directed RNA polymerase subunit D
MACVDVCKNSQAVKVEGDKSKFVFEFETDGSVTAKQALVKALAILEQKFEDFRELVSALETA